MYVGTVQKLVTERGFGFILADDRARYFFHMRDLRNLVFGNELLGLSVEFDADQGDSRGPRATNVRSIDASVSYLDDLP